MYITKTTRQFDKDFKLCIKRGCDPTLYTGTHSDLFK